MKKIIIKIISVFLGCCLLFGSLDFLFTTYNGSYTYRMMQEMYNYEDNIDVLFLGSSHMYRSLDPQKTSSIIGENAFNAGSSVQGMNTSYYLLQEVLKYHKVNTVVLDTNIAVSNVKETESSVFYISDYMKNSKTKFELIKSGGSLNIINGYVSFRRNFTNLNIISNIKSRFDGASDYSSVTKKEEAYIGNGFVRGYNAYKLAQADIEYASAIKVSSEKPVCKAYDKYLKLIIDLCADNNIDLILVDHPTLKEYYEAMDSYQNYIDYFVSLSKENNIQYWNYNVYYKDTCFTENDFSDVTHLNCNGAEKYTDLFCKTFNDYSNGIDVSNQFSDKFE